MQRGILLLASVAALGMLVFELSRRSDPAAATRNPMADELRALRQEVEALKRKSDARHIRYVPSAAAPSEAAPAAAEEHAPWHEPVEPADLEQQAKERNREVVTSLEVRFASERTDGEWSTQTVRQIRDVLAASAAGSRLMEADCATTLCRVVVSHETEADQQNLGTDVAELDPFRAGVVYDYEKDAQPRRTTLFVLRPGHSFADDTPNL